MSAVSPPWNRGGVMPISAVPAAGPVESRCTRPERLPCGPRTRDDRLGRLHSTSGGTMSTTGTSTAATGRSPGLLLSSVIHFVAEAIAIWVAASLISGIHVYGGAFTHLWLRVLFRGINPLPGGILPLLTPPPLLLPPR